MCVNAVLSSLSQLLIAILFLLALVAWGTLWTESPWRRWWARRKLMRDLGRLSPKISSLRRRLLKEDVDRLVGNFRTCSPRDILLTVEVSADFETFCRSEDDFYRVTVDKAAALIVLGGDLPAHLGYD